MVDPTFYGILEFSNISGPTVKKEVAKGLQFASETIEGSSSKGSKKREESASQEANYNKEVEDEVERLKRKYATSPDEMNSKTSSIYTSAEFRRAEKENEWDSRFNNQE